MRLRHNFFHFSCFEKFSTQKKIKKNRNLSSNKLYGTIPTQLGGLTNLQELYIYFILFFFI